MNTYAILRQGWRDSDRLFLPWPGTADDKYLVRGTDPKNALYEALLKPRKHNDVYGTYFVVLIAHESEFADCQFVVGHGRLLEVEASSGFNVRDAR